MERDARDEHGNPLPEECSFTRDNLEGYALSALDLSDQSRITNHLRWCDACTGEARHMVRVVEVLPYAVPKHDVLSDSTRGSLMARVTNAPEAATPGDVRPVQRQATATSGKAEVPPQTQFLGGMPRWLTSLVVGPLLVALIVVSAWGISQHNQLGDLQDQTISRGTLLSVGSNQGDIRVYTTRPACPKCSGKGQLGADPTNNKAVLLAWDLNPDEQHEVWCVHEDGKTNMVAMLNVNEVGQVMQTLEFSQPVAGYREIRIVRHDDSSPELIIAVRPDDESDATVPEELLAES